MRILVLISDRVSPSTNGARVRNLYLWPEIKKLGAEVRILGLDPYPTPDFSPSPPNIDSEFFPHERQTVIEKIIHSVAHSYHQWPYSKALERRLDQLVADWQPDIIHAEELRMAKYLPCMRGIESTAQQTVTFHNVESDLIEKTGSAHHWFLRPLVNKIHRINLRHYEKKIISECDLALAYSKHDMMRYAKIFRGGHWSYTSGGAHVNQKHYTETPDLPTLLIVGSLNYQPNIEGFDWFVKEVLPLLPKQALITVAGSKASAEMREKIRAADFKFIDTPANLIPIYQDHAICLVPLLSGSGTRGRILEALALGRPVVTTTKGAEGLAIEKGEGILIADSPIEYARKITLLMENPKERRMVSRSGFLKALKYFEWSVVAKDLLRQWQALTGVPQASMTRKRAQERSNPS